jgi:tetratricopeptide (TPR) repeat protein
MWLSLVVSRLFAQCPDRVNLRTRIIFLKSSTVSYGQQLNELLPISLQLENCPQKNDSTRVLLLQRIGALYYLTDKYNEAVKYTLSAIDLLQNKHNTYSDPAFLVKAYNFLQVYYDSLKLLPNKIDAIDSSIHYALVTDVVNDELLFNLWQRSTYSLDIGDFQRCFVYSSLGETLTQKLFSNADSLDYVANFFNNRMIALIELNFLDSARMAITKKIQEFLLIKEEKNLGSFYNHLSVIAIKQKKIEDALKYFKVSLNWHKKNRNGYGTKQALNNIGYLYVNSMNDVPSGLKYYREAFKYKTDYSLQASTDEIESLNIFGNIGNAFAHDNQFDSAFVYYQYAFDILGKGTDENTLADLPMEKFTVNPKLFYFTNLVRDKGATFIAQFRHTNDRHFLDEAIRTFKAADKILTKIKVSQAELVSKLAWRKDARSLYEQAILACHIGNRIDDAFYFFERNRAVLLNDQIHLNRIMSSNDFNARAQIETQLAKLRSRLQTIPSDDNEYADIQKNILFLSQQKDRISYQKKLTDTTAELSLTNFRKKHRFNGETLLEIFTGDSAVYVLQVSETSSLLKKIDKNKYENLSSGFISFVSDPVLANKNYNQFTSVANELYQLLFDDSKVDGKLVVSPDGDYFPFEALITGFGRNREPKYLIAATAVSYTYSAGFLLLDFAMRNNESSPTIFGMAPENFPETYNLAPLDGSIESLEKIVSGFSSSIGISGTGATKKEFLEQFHKYKIVQLYTHGSESGSHGEPVIYFADSSLSLSELVPVNKPATHLVILSACETAKGKFYQGEGVFSFNRAFAEAGIPTSIVNLWMVDDRSTYRLTELFYKHLSKGMSFDESLRQAKIEFINTSGREKALPFYWAATILTGQIDADVPTRQVPWKVILTGCLILIVILIIVKKYRKV